MLNPSWSPLLEKQFQNVLFHHEKVLADPLLQAG